MKNFEVAALLYEIADYLEILGEDFKPRAYRKAAQNIDTMSDDIENYGDLTELPGVGEGIAKKIKEFLDKGESLFLNKLKKQMPMDVDSLMNIEGIGPKTIKLLYEELKIKNIKDLQKAAKQGKIRVIKGLGEKTEQQILENIAFAKSNSERILLGEALPVAESIVNELKKFKDLEKIEIAGSVRRRKETIGDIDILAVCKDHKILNKKFAELDDVHDVLVQGKTKSSVRLNSGLQVDLRIIDKKSWGSALSYFSGSTQHNVELRRIAKKKEWKLSEYGLFKGKKMIAGKTEEEIYKKFGLSYIEPELRELRGEIEAARKGKLPKLVELKDVKGNLHMHTKYSDGTATVKEMADKAKQIGYEYICITDHFGSMKITNSMNLRRYEKQLKEINKLKNIKIFSGMEVNIKGNGSMDAPAKAMEKVDIVIGSIHSGFKDTKEKMTKRFIAAIENKYVKIIGHPTARLLNKRRPVVFDVDKVFQAAKDNDKILEVNCNPQRLDLNDVNIMKALEIGCKLSFGTDAHSVDGLDHMKYGVFTARRGWAEKKDFINTMSLKKFDKNVI